MHGDRCNYRYSWAIRHKAHNACRITTAIADFTEVLIASYDIEQGTMLRRTKIISALSAALIVTSHLQNMTVNIFIGKPLQHKCVASAIPPDP